MGISSVSSSLNRDTEIVSLQRPYVLPENFYNLDVKWPYRLSGSPFVTQLLKEGLSMPGKGGWFGSVPWL